MNPDLERLRDDIKRTMTMDEVLRILGLPEPNRQRKIRSIFNSAERTPSLHVYQYDWYDYSTGNGGDQIAFVMAVTGKGYVQALEMLGRGQPLAVRPRKETEVPFELPNYTARYQSKKTAQNGEAWAQWERTVLEKWPYLGMSGLAELSVGKLVDGDGKAEFWIPHWHQPDEGTARIVGIKVRGLDGAKYAVEGSCFIAGLYRPIYPFRDATHALVVEGESDAWVMCKMLKGRDVTVYGLPSGAGALKPRFAKELENYETVGLAFDDDDPGHKAESWFLERLPRTAWVVDVPGGRVAEAAAQGWRL